MRTKKKKLGSIGRIESYKGTNYILDGFLLASKQHPNLELHIAFGDKSMENLHPNIKVITPANDLELSDYYNSLDILLVGGTVQLGAVHYPVIEAMACKIPVINTGYFPATDANSWIVPIKNHQAIAKCILQIISSPTTTLIKIENGINDIQQFRWELVSEKMYRYFLI